MEHILKDIRAKCVDQGVGRSRCLRSGNTETRYTDDIMLRTSARMMSMKQPATSQEGQLVLGDSLFAKARVERPSARSNAVEGSGTLLTVNRTTSVVPMASVR